MKAHQQTSFFLTAPNCWNKLVVVDLFFRLLRKNQIFQIWASFRKSWWFITWLYKSSVRLTWRPRIKRSLDCTQIEWMQPVRRCSKQYFVTALLRCFHHHGKGRCSVFASSECFDMCVLGLLQTYWYGHTCFAELLQNRQRPAFGRLWIQRSTRCSRRTKSLMNLFDSQLRSWCFRRFSRQVPTLLIIHSFHKLSL